MFKTIILLSSNRFKDERTSQAIYHVLQGKKSIQTIQDAYLYQLSTYYGILPSLEQRIFKQTIHELVSDGYLEPSKTYDHSYTITVAGKQAIKEDRMPHILSNLHGKKYGAHGIRFEKRILLFVQVLSNKQAGNTNYVPVIDDYSIKHDIKQIFRQLQTSSTTLSEQFFKECHDLLSSIDNQYALLFVQRLSGYKQYGMSLQQLAHNFRQTEVDTLLIYRSIIHYMMKNIQLNGYKYPLLSLLSKGHENDQLTITARQTKNLVTQGYSLEQIAAHRNLKLNTIYDHIVEIVLIDETFLIDPFISEDQITTILQTVHSLQTYQLRELKNALGDDYSYFQIRLALARGGTING